MIRVQKGNAQYRISEDKLSAYEKQGYKRVEAAPPVAPEERPISRMNKEELLAKAAAMGITVPEGAGNDAIRDLIKAAGGQ